MAGRGAVLRRVAASRPLRRIELAFLGFSCAEHGVWVAMVVYAYQQGGTGEAAVIAVVQLLPAAAVAPWAARLTDRRGGAVGLWTGYVAQALGMGATAALLLSGAPAVAAYAGAVFAASAVTLTRPAQAALLPTIVDDPAELTAANAVTGWLESVSVFIGPALSGVLIALEGPGAAFALFAVAATGSAVLVGSIARESWRVTGAAAADGEDEDAPGVLAALRAQPGTVALLAVFAIQFVAYGAFDVLVVVLAIEVLDIGASGGGFLNAAFGAGGVVGGAAALLLVGRRGLVGPLLAAASLWGGAFVLIGAVPTVVGVFALMAIAGGAWTVLDVAGRTLLQRAVPGDVRGRVFGVLEGVSMLALAAGSLSVPLLAALGGPRLAVGAIGALLIVAAASMHALLRELDRAAPLDAELALLRGSPIFGALAAPELEGVARSLERAEVAAGETVCREGEAGDRFYLVAAGAFDVSVAGRPVRELGPGDGFGEIALLRDGIRTSTVTAREPARVYVLGRAAFLDAVTGHPQAHRAAEAVAADRLRGG